MSETPDTQNHPVDTEAKNVSDWQNMCRGGVLVFALLGAIFSVLLYFVDWTIFVWGARIALGLSALFLAQLIAHNFIAMTAAHVEIRRVSISTAVTAAYLKEIESAMNAGRPMDEIARNTVRAQGKEGERAVAFMEDYRARLRGQGDQGGEGA